MGLGGGGKKLASLSSEKEKGESLGRKGRGKGGKTFLC